MEGMEGGDGRKDEGRRGGRNELWPESISYTTGRAQAWNHCRVVTLAALPAGARCLLWGAQAWPDSMASDLGHVPGADSLLNGAEKLIKAKET